MKNALDFPELARLSENKARKHLEKLRWPKGPVCPHCGEKGAYRLKAKSDSNKPVRSGVYKCKECRKQYSVTVNTIFQGSRIPLNKWLMVVSIMCASKKGVSAHQIHRMIGVSYKTAWFMCHRIRQAMAEGPLADKLKGITEADETYIGGKGKGRQRGRNTEKKAVVFTLVERGGKARSTVVENVTAATLLGEIKKNVARDATIMTDEYKAYARLGLYYKRHGRVRHSLKEYAKDDVHVNAAEGYFSILKRGIHGTFHHVGKQHLERYLKEFDFRWNTRQISDKERFVKVIKGSKNKKLHYRKSGG